jgi:hypothetical protein
MKHVIFLIFLFLNLNAFSQSFKITSVKTSKTHKFQEMNQRLLNKSIKTVFNDGTVKVTLAGENKPLTLIQNRNNNNTYSFTATRGDMMETYSIKFNKTVGVISSLIFHSYKEYKNKTGLMPILEEHNEIAATRF